MGFVVELPVRQVHGHTGFKVSNVKFCTTLAGILDCLICQFSNCKYVLIGGTICTERASRLIGFTTMTYRMKVKILSVPDSFEPFIAVACKGTSRISRVTSFQNCCLPQCLARAHIRVLAIASTVLFSVFS